MSNQLATIVKSIQPHFEKRNSQNLAWENECGFALQQVQKNDFTLKTAMNNQQSLQAAILNVAAIGISLNPASAQAYLVPREGSICLDISYRGLVKLATEAGGILWAKSELVYTDDEFIYKGPAQAPEHNANVFAPGREPTERTIKGCYTIAKTPQGDILTDVMTIKEILDIRNTSMAFTRAKEGRRGPWENFFGEMCKKSAIKRAAKQWPYTNRERLDAAIDVINQHEGIVVESIKAVDAMSHSPEQKTEFDSLLAAGDAMAVYCYLQHVGAAVNTSLFNSFEKGEVTKFKRLISALTEQGRKEFISATDALHNHIASQDAGAAIETIEELGEFEKTALISELDAEEIMFIRDAGITA